jgi:endonuclease/exonuclease/phosphatase family metal-dependent hydrolase
MLRIMTLNLRFGRAPDGPHAWPKRKGALPLLFADHPADIYCFQEANDFQVNELRAILPNHAVSGIRPGAPPFWQHNVVFTPEQWPIQKRDRFFVSPTPDIPSRMRVSKWPRQGTIVHLHTPTGPLICVNTHFDFAPVMQVEGAAVIRHRLTDYPTDCPCILTGDFNASPGGAGFEAFTGPPPDGPHRQFVSAFSSPFPATYHAFTGKTDGAHIDWILHTCDLRVDRAFTVTEPFDGVLPSDHFPVVAWFTFVKEGASDERRETTGKKQGSRGRGVEGSRRKEKGAEGSRGQGLPAYGGAGGDQGFEGNC